jgi:hypothetical protein
MDDLMKLPGNKLNVVKNNFSESDSDNKSQESRFDSFSSSTGLVNGTNTGSRQSSFSSGKSQESKPLTAFKGKQDVPEQVTGSIMEECQDYPVHPRYANCPDSDSNERYAAPNDEEQSLAHVPCLPDPDSLTCGVSDC